MTHQYKYGVFICRAQPFHKAHKELVDLALSKAEELIIVLGSARTAPNIKNPWSPDERKEMILSCYDWQQSARIHFVHARDFPYNDDCWMAQVHHSVTEITGDSESVLLLGYMKDKSSRYLKWFPQWDLSTEVDHLEKGISATLIRNSYFSNQKGWHDKGLIWEQAVPQPVKEWLETWQKTSDYDNLCNEYSFVESYREPYKQLPYPVVFTTVDAVVTKTAHVLLIRRKSHPGKGLWALPGGFIKPEETLSTACIRELKEETRIKGFTQQDLADLIRNQKHPYIFDNPNRSLRGRTITHAWRFQLPEDGTPLPRVRGDDDAQQARWFPFGDLPKDKRFYEDHRDILFEVLGI